MFKIIDTIITMSLQEILDRFDEKAKEKLRNLQEQGLERIEADRLNKIQQLTEIAERFREQILELREKAIDRFREQEEKKQLEEISRDFQNQISIVSSNLIQEF